jgi:hypothetical protein
VCSGHQNSRRRMVLTLVRGLQQNQGKFDGRREHAMAKNQFENTGDFPRLVSIRCVEISAFWRSRSLSSSKSITVQTPQVPLGA